MVITSGEKSFNLNCGQFSVSLHLNRDSAPVEYKGIRGEMGLNRGEG